MIVETTSGAVDGRRRGHLVSWRGIPYAAAPVGALRWQAPRPHEGWRGRVLAADRFGGRAVQPVHLPFRVSTPSIDDGPFGEDCLVLNVSAPAEPPAGPLPVLVWFHGGGYHVGSGAGFGVGDGDAFVRDGIIVVTVNYRLGALGFLDVSGHLDAPDSANLGLLDQVRALEWVRSEIAAFGGDPARVTIAGLSAGAKSVMNLMATPSASGLFRAAIAESGGDHLATPEQDAEVTAAFLAAFERQGFGPDQLLTAPAEAVLGAQKALGEGGRATWIWRPSVDGRVIPLPLVAALRSGCAAGIPLVAGTTARETETYRLRDDTALAQTERVFAEIFGSRATAVLDAYRSARGGDEAEALVAAMTDERYGVATERVLDAQSDHAPVWRYLFDAPTPGWPAEMRAIHAADLPLWWRFGPDATTDAGRMLGVGMHESWARFVIDGSPSGEGLPAWPSTPPGTRTTMVLTERPGIDEAPRERERLLWRAIDWTPGTWWPLPTAFPDATGPAGIL